MFPIIQTINDVLPHIEGKENFKVNYKDDYIVIDYLLNTPEMFNNPYQKECRGIIFHSDGRIMSRRLHKFFNLNEREESRIENVDLSEPHWILEKLDGSMITPMISNGKLTWGSKAGVTFLTPQIEAFVEKNPLYKHFALYFIDQSLTPIFEWCSRQNRIVIDHPEDRLVLIAVRDNIHGHYFSYVWLELIKRTWDIEIVKQYQGSVQNMQQLSDTVKGMTGIEGFVIAFESGHRIKMKCDEYCLYHRAKDDITFEKNVVAILIEGKADDFRTLLSPLDRGKFEDFEKDFWYSIINKTLYVTELSEKYNFKTMSRKTFAVDFGNKVTPIQKSIIFKLFDENLSLPLRRDAVKMEIINIIKKNTGSQAGIDKVRELFGNLHWQY